MQIIAACLGKSNDLPRPKGVDGKALGGGVLCTNMLEKAYKQVRGAEAQRKLWCGVGVSVEGALAGAIS